MTGGRIRLLLVMCLVGLSCPDSSRGDERPNILFCFADDWGRYAGLYRDPIRPGLNDIVQTPALDALGRSGVVFNNAFVSAPSCTPSRAAVVTGMPFYRCGSNAFLRCREYGRAPDPYRELPGFSELLLRSGYHVMHWGKTTNKSAGRRDRTHELPINYFSQAVTAADDAESRKREIFSFVRENFSRFLEGRREGQPFFYWFGPHNSHRQWERGSGKRLWGLDPDALKGRVPKFLPDVPAVREDLADYLGEAQAWDGMVHELISELQRQGELENTLVIVSGDHGMPGMPRGKCNLHDFGSAVALLVNWPKRIQSGRRIDDFVSLMDLAPTILEAAEIERPAHMLARSLMPLLTAKESGQIDLSRDHVIIGRERHVGEARRDRAPYPSRAIRTQDYLLIRNFAPDRMPMGEVFEPEATADQLLEDHYPAYPDMDAGPTKVFLMQNRNDWPMHFEVAFGLRPPLELYDLSDDAEQMNNVALEPDYKDILDELNRRLMNELRETGDPRVIGFGETFDRKPFVDPEFSAPRRQKKVLSF